MKLGSSLRRRRKGRSSGKGGSGVAGALRTALWALGLAALGLGGGYLLATLVIFPAPPPPGDLVVVPPLRGGSLEVAAEHVDATGLTLGKVRELHHPAVDSGVVFGQSPLPGQLARPESPVRVTVSLGPELREVPDVARLRLDRARQLLEATGFEVVVDSVQADVPRGRIVAVEPEPGSELPVPGEVKMMVSLGPPRVPMPRILGMNEEEARDTLRALGLVVGSVDEVFRFGGEQGVVVEQVPPADSLVEMGSAVRLSVGRSAAADTSRSQERRPEDGGRPGREPNGNKSPRQP